MEPLENSMGVQNFQTVNLPTAQIKTELHRDSLTDRIFDMSYKSRGNYPTGGMKLTDEEWDKIMHKKIMKRYTETKINPEYYKKEYVKENT